MCAQAGGGAGRDGAGASLPLPTEGGATDIPSGEKSGGIKGFFSKLGVRRSGSVPKPDAPEAGAVTGAGTTAADGAASVPAAGGFLPPPVHSARSVLFC